MRIRGLNRNMRRSEDVKLTAVARMVAALRLFGGGIWMPDQRVFGDGAPNLFTSPEDFASAVWAKVGCTPSLSSTVLAPDGSGMTLLTENTSTGAHYVLATAISGVGKATQSWVVKPNGRTLIKLRSESPQTGSLSTTFNLTGAGSVVGIGTIQALANGLYYITAASSANGTGASGYHLLQTLDAGANESYTGDGVSGVYVWGAKLEPGSVATAYTPQSVLRTRGVYVDIVGATPVTAVADLIGLITDKSYGGALGGELFAGTYLTGSATTATYSGREATATFTGAGGLLATANNWLSISGTTAIGTYSVIEYWATWVSGGSLEVGSTWQLGDTITAASNSGVKKKYITRVRTPYAGIGYGPASFSSSTAGSVWKIEIISVREALGNHASQSAVASKPTVQRVPKRVGPNSVANGTFDTNIDGWTSATGAGAQAWATGALRRAVGGGNGGSYIDVPVIAGKTYQVGGAISNLVGSGGVGIYFYTGGGFTGLGASLGATGTTTTVAATNNIRVYLYTDTTRGADFDTIAVQEVLEWANVITFDPNNDFLTASVNAVGAGETLIVGCTPTGGAGTVRAALVRRDDTAKTGMMIYADAANTWQLVSGNTVGFVATPFGGPATLNTPAVLSAVCNGNTATPYLNGVAGTPATSLAPVASAATPLHIGSLAGTFPFPGHVYAAARVPVAMSDAYRCIVEQGVAALEGRTI